MRLSLFLPPMPMVISWFIKWLWICESDGIPRCWEGCELLKRKSYFRFFAHTCMSNRSVCYLFEVIITPENRHWVDNSVHVLVVCLGNLDDKRKSDDEWWTKQNKRFSNFESIITIVLSHWFIEKNFMGVSVSFLMILTYLKKNIDNILGSQMKAHRYTYFFSLQFWTAILLTQYGCDDRVLSICCFVSLNANTCGGLQFNSNLS